MIRFDVPQNSPEWWRVRAGIPTSSEFSKIVTPTGKLSTQADAYACRLIAERLLGESFPKSIGFEENYWTERGKLYEADAVRLYEFALGVRTELAGFITNDDGTAGCSPDRLVGADGLVEIKCPSPWIHVENVISEKIDRDHVPQVQGQLLITGRSWVDWYSYHPDFPPSRIRTERDEKYLSILAPALEGFCELMLKKIEILANKGFYVVTPIVQQQNETEVLNAHG